jgi:hypothetical protein
MIYDEIVALRRGLKEVDGYKTLAQVGFDWPWVTPYQKASCSPDGPVLVAYNWLDVESVDEHRDVLELHGYLPCMAFNRVLKLALKKAGMCRGQIYVTQAFHLLPIKGRSTRIPPELVNVSFKTVTRHELVDRRVIALGEAAARACDAHGIKHDFVPHPSARRLTYERKAQRIAELLRGDR